MVIRLRVREEISSKTTRDIQQLSQLRGGALKADPLDRVNQSVTCSI